jgi:hypothetical protein
MGLASRLHQQVEGRSERSTLVTIVRQMERLNPSDPLDLTSVPGMREGLDPRMSVGLDLKTRRSTRFHEPTEPLTYQPPLTNTSFILNSPGTHPDPPPASWRSGCERPNTSPDASRSRYYPNLLGSQETTTPSGCSFWPFCRFGGTCFETASKPSLASRRIGTDSDSSTRTQAPIRESLACESMVGTPNSERLN